MPRARGTTTAAVLCLAIAAVGADAEDVGQAIHGQHWATCHGADGTGAGPLSQVLTVMPPDLTRQSAANDGTVPMPGVVHVIDDRTGLRAHGGRVPA